MKVKDLIEALVTLDPELEVWVGYPTSGQGTSRFLPANVLRTKKPKRRKRSNDEPWPRVAIEFNDLANWQQSSGVDVELIQDDLGGTGVFYPLPDKYFYEVPE